MVIRKVTIAANIDSTASVVESNAAEVESISSKSKRSSMRSQFFRRIFPRIAEGIRQTEHERRRNNSHFRDRCGSLSSAADGAAATATAAAVPDSIRGWAISWEWSGSASGLTRWTAALQAASRKGATRFRTRWRACRSRFVGRRISLQRTSRTYEQPKKATSCSKNSHSSSRSVSILIFQWPAIKYCRQTRNTKRAQKQCREITLILFGRAPRDIDETLQQQRVGVLMWRHFGHQGTSVVHGKDIHGTSMSERRGRGWPTTRFHCATNVHDLKDRHHCFVNTTPNPFIRRILAHDFFVVWFKAQDLSHRDRQDSLCLAKQSFSHLAQHVLHVVVVFFKFEQYFVFHMHSSPTFHPTIYQTFVALRFARRLTLRRSIDCVFRLLAGTQSLAGYDPKDLTEKEDISILFKPMCSHTPSMTSTCDLAESIAISSLESDLDEEQIRNMLVSPLYLQEREQVPTDHEFITQRKLSDKFISLQRKRCEICRSVVTRKKGESRDTFRQKRHFFRTSVSSGRTWKIAQVLSSGSCQTCSGRTKRSKNCRSKIWHLEARM